MTIGLDSAPAMVATALRGSGAPCVVALGEATPFRVACFDALTVASALHWVDEDRFFTESHRVLCSGGWLAIYDHYFGGIQGQPAYAEWVTDTYLQRYPVPFQGPRFGPASDVPVGFQRIGHRTYDDPRPMTRSEIVDYHLSQSFVLAALAERDEDLERARAWVDEELRQFVSGDTIATVKFVCTVAVLERLGRKEASGGDGL